MVFDHAGNYLYITTSDGFVRPYNFSTGQLETGYNLGGSLNGVDIAPDDSFLLIAQNNLQASQIIIHRLSLTNGAVTNIGFTPLYFESATGAWDVAIGANGLALVTAFQGGSGAIAFIRQIDLATNAISQRNDVQGANGALIWTRTQIHRSADGSRLYFLGPDDSGGPVFTYDANTDKFGITVDTNIFTDSAGAAVNRNGSLIATRLTGNGAALDTGPSLSFVRSFNQPDGGVAFDAQSDTLYTVINSAGQIVAYDTNTFLEKFRFDIGETISAGVTQFGTGTLIASADGRYLALETPSGIRVYNISAVTPVPAPTPTFGTPRDMVFDHAGQHLYITTADGLVWPYNLSSGTFDAPYNLGGLLNGIDIAADDSFLLVAQGYSGIAQGTFEKLDLGTGAVTNINYTHRMFNAWTWSGEWGAWNVVIASNGLGFGTTDAVTIGDVSLIRQIDLSNYTTTTRTDIPGSGGGTMDQQTQVHRSADGTRLYFQETDGFYAFTYSASANTFAPVAVKEGYLSSSAVNRDGTLLGSRLRNTSYARLDAAPNFVFVHNFNYLDSGIAFDAVQDTFYGVNSSKDQIVAYDTNSFAERFRFDIGENVSSGALPIGIGTLVASQDGHYLALITPTAVRVYGVPAVQLVSVASAKIHGSAGTFNVDLPLDGTPGIECRSGGPNGNFTMVFTFGLNLVSVGGASVTSGFGSVSSSAIDSNDSHRYVVNLTGVSNAQYIKVTLTNVIDSTGSYTGSISQQIGVLLGDTNGDGVVNVGDTVQTRSQAGNDLTAANFREDVNADGLINVGDTALVRNQSGTTLPTQQTQDSFRVTLPAQKRAQEEYNR
jgi:hypothetical protein